jgi:hypothetical protein
MLITPLYPKIRPREARFLSDPPDAGSGVQGVDQLIQFVRQRRVHVSLNYQPSTLNHSGGLFSVAPVLRPPARRYKPRNGSRPPQAHLGSPSRFSMSFFFASSSLRTND